MISKKPYILVVDDDPGICELLCEVFERNGFAVRAEMSCEAAVTTLNSSRPNVILSDIRMKTRHDGLNLLEYVQRECPATPVILMTAFGSVETAVRAVQQGAFDYVSKPFRMDTVVATVRRALTLLATSARGPATALDEELETAPGIVGRHPSMLEIYKVIGRVADASAAVLITGESGTGKELVASAIHRHGRRHTAPFVAVNCGALTETLLESELFGHLKGSFTGAVARKRGIFEQAEGGTVFLDEISETSQALQVKLLRVLQEREITPVGGTSAVALRARVIAACNTDLEKLCEAGLFRRDLLYRLNVINIHLPPLRERRDDIPLLASHLLRKHTPPNQLTPELTDDTLNRLLDYSWPGNIRELENVIERAITLKQGAYITLNDLPPNVLTGEPRAVLPQQDAAGDSLAGFFEEIPTMDELLHQHLRNVLTATGGNKKRAAEILGINRRTLYRMAARFGIDL